MSYQFTISDIGLRLIKAYEGFRPSERTLKSGKRVVGFGHIVDGDQAAAMSEDEAETQLKADLESVEDLVNSSIHASMTQSQFDALCSLAFSIGERAFLSSSVLHAMNQGQVINAANGFDRWRLGNIGGKIYVVDALVRRRTAEKALFLRPTQRTARAPRYELTAIKDTDLPQTSTEHVSDMDDMIEEDDLVMDLSQQSRREAEAETKTPEDPAEPVRRSLGQSSAQVLYADETDTFDDDLDVSLETSLAPAAELELIDTPIIDAPEIEMAEADIETSFIDTAVNDGFEDIADEAADFTQTLEADTDTGLELITRETLAEPPAAEPTSPIAEAAAAVSDRLDALIDNDSAEDEAWPESLITAEPAPTPATLDARASEADIVIDELQQDDALREQIARESQYNTDRYVDYVDPPEPTGKASVWAFITMTLVGLTAAIIGLVLNLKGSATILGENGPMIAVTAMFIGAMLFFMGLYYMMKALFSRT